MIVMNIIIFEIAEIGNQSNSPQLEMIYRAVSMSMMIIMLIIMMAMLIVLMILFMIRIKLISKFFI